MRPLFRPQPIDIDAFRGFVVWCLLASVTWQLTQVLKAPQGVIENCGHACAYRGKCKCDCGAAINAEYGPRNKSPIADRRPPTADSK